MTRRPIQLEYAAFAFLLIFNVISLLSIASARSGHGQGWEETWAEKRADMIRQLEKEPKSDIVFVRYPAGFDIVNSEWVFNEASVENSSVIWVRWGSVELNQQVTAAYPNRRVWELQFDEKCKPLLCEFGF